MFLGPMDFSSQFFARRVSMTFVIAGLLFSCHQKQEKPTENISQIGPVVKVPFFSGDSAYAYTARQVEFGPRIPNTPAHRAAGDYLVAKLKEFGAAVVVQEFTAQTFDHQKLFLRNIIASYSPEKQKRVLLAAHWDTRPFADKDEQKPESPFDGANDGGSGVAVLLEIARAMNGNSPPAVGVDLIFFDGEDWGEKENTSVRVQPAEGGSWWCLGSQYWAKNKHRPNYSAYYGILLDMVGAKGAHFFQEGGSVEYAPKIVEKVWRTASRLGYSSVFVSQREDAVLDDHVFVNEVGKIPMIDIVHFEPGVGYFGDFHHNRRDHMSLISKETLTQVGTVILNVVYSEE